MMARAQAKTVICKPRPLSIIAASTTTQPSRTQPATNDARGAGGCRVQTLQAAPSRLPPTTNERTKPGITKPSNGVPSSSASGIPSPLIVKPTPQTAAVSPTTTSRASSAQADAERLIGIPDRGCRDTAIEHPLSRLLL